MYAVKTFSRIMLHINYYKKLLSYIIIIINYYFILYKTRVATAAAQS